MNLQGHYDWRRPQPKVTPASLLLLLIFVAAAAFTAGAAMQRPWADHSSSAQASGVSVPVAPSHLSDAVTH